MSNSTTSKTVVFRRRETSSGSAYYNVTAKRSSNLKEILTASLSGMRVRVVSQSGLSLTKAVLAKAKRLSSKRS